jgi:ribosome-binding factor A
MEVMQSLRHERVRELLKREIGEVLRRELPIEQVGVLSVNEVGVANDLHSAVVYVGVIGSEVQKKRAVELLRKDRKRIQGLVARSVILKYTPQLKFIFDESIERGNRVLEILEELEKTPPSDEHPSEDR